LKVNTGRIGPNISSYIRGEESEGFKTIVGEIFDGDSSPYTICP